MSLLLMALGLIVLFVLFVVLASKVYPSVTGKAPAQAEQELTGVGPEATKGEPDDTFMG